jgi:hypothetical protein
MKTLIFTCLSMLVYGSLSAQSVTIDPNANNSGIINVQSTNKGVLVPNMTSTQRTSITSPQKGLLVFDTNTNSFWFHNGTAWVELVSGTSQWTSFNSNLYSTSNYFSLLGGTNIAPLSSGVGNDGTLRIFSPSSGTYANLDGQTIQTRSSNIFGSKTERDFRINPFGGNVGVGVTTPTAKLHLGGSMKIDGSNTLELGAGVAGKEINAGKIGYRTFGAMDALDIVGAGNTVAQRKINLWAEGGTKLIGGLSLPGKIIVADYTPTDIDFTIIADMENNPNKLITITLPPANASNEGRVYIINAINLPILSEFPLAVGCVLVLGFDKLYIYEEPAPTIFGEDTFVQQDSFIFQNIGNQWFIVVRHRDTWRDG